MAKKNIPQFVKDKFDYDVSGLDPYIDEQSDEILQALLEDSLFMSRCNVMTGVKGSEKIKMLSSSIVLQSAATCGWNASGGVVFTDETITNERLKFQEEYCNETLNGAWTQMKNKIGANIQDLENPFADVIVAYKIKETKRAIQALLLNGDTLSLNANLAFFDGLVKLWDADAALLTATVGANDFESLLNVSRAIPSEIKSNMIDHEVLCDIVLMQGAIDYVFTNKDFNALLAWEENEAGELTFVLPTTTTKFRAVPELSGTGKAYAVPYPYVSVAVDGDSDEEGVEVKYNEHDEKLRVGAKFRLGVKYVYPEYFVKLVAAS